MKRIIVPLLAMLAMAFSPQHPAVPPPAPVAATCEYCWKATATKRLLRDGRWIPLCTPCYNRNHLRAARTPRRRRIRPYAAAPPPAALPVRRPERPVTPAPTPATAPPEPVLTREAVERWPEVVRPAAEMEPSPDVVRTQPLRLVEVRG